MTEELLIDGVVVDLEPDAATTLNFKSNLFGDISKITASNSQTIRCPKTTRNRATFDNPGAVAYLSGKRYRRYAASLVRRGVEVVRVGHAVLLSAAEAYEIALYWGVMTRFEEWVDRGAKLCELTGSEALTWDKSVTATALSTFKSRGYGYAAYDCGVTDPELVNIHPSVTAWWILEKIASEAGFTFEMPARYENALRAIAVPCLGRKASPESWEAEKSCISIGSRNIREYASGSQLSYRNSVFQARNATQRRPVYIGEKAKWRYYPPNGGGQQWTTVNIAEFSTLSIKRISLYIDAKTVETNMYTRICMYTRSEGEQYNQQKPFKSWDISSDRVVSDEIDCTSFDFYVFVMQRPPQENAIYDIYMEIIPHAEDVLYPSALRIVPNLPEITQIDFIKAVCGMLGIFVVGDPADTANLKFVSVDVLQSNKGIARDWSDRLVAGNEDEPRTVEFKVGEYARRNLFKYKQDDTVETNADGILTIASELLEKEKTVLTLPFAPSDGSKIPHYKLSEDGTEVEEVQVKDRIMRLVKEGSALAKLSFNGLDFDLLLSIYYASLSQLLNRAILISEQIDLSELDLKSLDYTIPFYLRQYGKYYGIVSIQSAAGKPCEVKAVQLPETITEGGSFDPSLPFNTIRVREEPYATYLEALYPLESDVTVEYDYFGHLTGDEPNPGSIVFRKGFAEVSLGPKTRDYDRTELRSLAPSSDSKYNYLISR